MQEPNWKTCTPEELWKFVGGHLSQNGIDSILVGGAVASIYSEGAYQSGDLDFVIQSLHSNHLTKIMAQIGFIEKAPGEYIHPQCKHLFIEFVKPPLAIGDDYKITPEEQVIEGKTIKILSPTDCVRDRLAAYIFWNAREGLDQALLVAKNHPIDLKKVESWCRHEGGLKQFKEFKNKLGKH